jgi:hypothetical protein
MYLCGIRSVINARRVARVREVAHVLQRMHGIDIPPSTMINQDKSMQMNWDSWDD